VISMFSSSILCKTWFLGLLVAASATAQIAQDRPELCGQSGAAIPVPAGVTAISDASRYRSELRIEDARKTVVLPGIMESVQQVCPLAGGELIVFGIASPALYNIAIVRLADGSLVDSFLGFEPVLAPNRRWLVRRKFYPAQAVTSEEYLLYDTTRDGAYNRSPGIGRDDADLVGTVIYPEVRGGEPFYNVNLPRTETHTFRSRSFYWAADSRAVVFADSVQGRLSMVLVSIGQTGTAAYVYPVSDSEACDASPDSPLIMLLTAEISPLVQGRREIRANFTVGQSPCRKTLTLQSSDFKAAIPEVHVMPHPAQSTPVGK
jgi:hypothetical protein